MLKAPFNRSIPGLAIAGVVLLNTACNTATSRAKKAYLITEAAQDNMMNQASLALNGEIPQDVIETYKGNLKSLKVKKEGDALVQACLEYLDYLSNTFKKIYDESINQFSGAINTLELQLGIYNQTAQNPVFRTHGVSQGFEKRAADTQAKLQSARADLEAAKKQFAPILEGLAEIKKARKQIIDIGSTK